MHKNKKKKLCNCDKVTKQTEKLLQNRRRNVRYKHQNENINKNKRKENKRL